MVPRQCHLLVANSPINSVAGRNYISGIVYELSLTLRTAERILGKGGGGGNGVICTSNFKGI